MFHLKTEIDRNMLLQYESNWTYLFFWIILFCFIIFQKFFLFLFHWFCSELFSWLYIRLLIFVRLTGHYTKKDVMFCLAHSPALTGYKGHHVNSFKCQKFWDEVLSVFHDYADEYLHYFVYCLVSSPAIFSYCH